MNHAYMYILAHSNIIMPSSYLSSLCSSSAGICRRIVVASLEYGNEFGSLISVAATLAITILQVWNCELYCCDQRRIGSNLAFLWGERQIRSVADVTRLDARLSHDLKIRPQLSLKMPNWARLAVKEETKHRSAVIVP